MNRKIAVIVAVVVVIAAVLVGCSQATMGGSDSMAYIDPENLIDDPSVSKYGEGDLLRLGAKKVDDLYVKEVTFCGNPGQLKFKLDTDGTLITFYYETEFNNIDNKNYVDRFVSAYNLLYGEYGGANIIGEYFTESQPETSECSIDTFKNNARMVDVESSMYSFTFPLNRNPDDPSFKFTKSATLKIIINNAVGNVMILLDYYGL